MPAATGSETRADRGVIVHPDGATTTTFGFPDMILSASDGCREVRIERRGGIQGGMPMSLRLGPGPVFVYESITAARRWQHFAMRAGTVCLMLMSMSLLGFLLYSQFSGSQFGSNTDVPLKFLAQLGSYFYYAISGVQVTLVLLAAPAATSGAICLDRARGALTHIFVTDLSDREIVLGKLGAKLVPVFGIIVAAIPVLAIASLLGGIIPEALVSLTVVSMALAVFACALALAVSVRATKSHEVLMAVFTFWTLWILFPLFTSLLSLPNLPGWYLKLNPFVLAWAPYAWPDYAGFWDFAIFAAVMLTGALGCVVSALRGLRQEPSRDKGPWRWQTWLANGIVRRVPRLSKPPELDANPFFWREWHRGRPSRLARAVWGIFWSISIVASVWSVMNMLNKSGGGSSSDDGVLLCNGLHVTFGLLLVSLYAPTVLSEERTRGSLDVLMTTPLSTESIVMAKWWGAYRMVPRLAILPMLTTAVVLLSLPEILVPPAGWMANPLRIGMFSRLCCLFFPIALLLAQGAVVTSFGLLMATWFTRPGRAVAVSVTIYVILAFGIPVTAELIADSLLNMIAGVFGLDSYMEMYQELFLYGYLALCPLGGQYMPAELFETMFQISSSGSDRNSLFVSVGIFEACWWLVLGLVLVLTLMIAGGLFALTLLSFNRCVGRASESPRKVRMEPTRTTWRRPRPVVEGGFAAIQA